MNRAKETNVEDMEDLLKFLNRLGSTSHVSLVELSEPHTVVHVDSGGNATVTNIKQAERFFLLSVTLKRRRK